MQESLGRRQSEPVKLNNFSKSETVLSRTASNGLGGDPRKAQQANTVQTVVVGTTVSPAVASPPKGNGFCLTGPVTDL